MIEQELDYEDDLSYAAAYIESVIVILDDMDEGEISKENVLRLYAIEHLLKSTSKIIKKMQEYA